MSSELEFTLEKNEGVIFLNFTRNHGGYITGVAGTISAEDAIKLAVALIQIADGDKTDAAEKALTMPYVNIFAAASANANANADASDEVVS